MSSQSAEGYSEQNKTIQKRLFLLCDSVQCGKLVSPFGKDISPAFQCYIILQLPDDTESQPRIPQTGIPSTISFVTSVYPVLPSVYLYAWRNSTPTQRSFMKFDI